MRVRSRFVCWGSRRSQATWSSKVRWSRGLSGIDYDPTTDSWIAISDDRSDNNPARYYELGGRYGESGFEAIDFQSVVTLVHGNGQSYPNKEQGGNVPDLESIRFDPATEALWYTSEGSRNWDSTPSSASH